MHFLCEYKNGGGKDHHGVARHPGKLRQDKAVIAREGIPPGIDRMHEGEKVCNRLERPADQIQVEPCPRQPSAQIREQRAAYAADLLIRKHAPAEQANPDEQQRGGEGYNDRQKDACTAFQAQWDRHCEAHRHLRNCYRHKRGRIA